MSQKRKPGRPTKYSEEILEKSREYLESYESIGDMIPSVEGLSLYINIRRSTIYEWMKHDDKTAFSDILEEINATQKKVLVNKGLSGDFNSNITKLCLGKHGMTEKVAIGGDEDMPAIKTEPTLTKEQALAVLKENGLAS